MAATEAATPRASIGADPVSSINDTPATPRPAPASWRGPGRSEISAQAKSIITSGAVAMTVEAALVGSRCAAT